MRASMPLALIALAVVLTAGPSSADETFQEDFTTTIYKDEAATTATWDTAAGEVRLAPFEASILDALATLGSALRVDVEGDYAYVADGASGITVIDISDPQNLILRANLDTPHASLGIDVTGDHAYVADDNGGLWVVDVSDPDAPAEVARLVPYVDAQDVVVDGTLAYVASGVAGLLIFDVSDPTSPAFLGQYDTSAVADGIAVSGNLVFLSDQSFIYAIDVTDPMSPQLLDSTFMETYGIAAEGDLWVAAGSAFRVIDASDPTNLQVVGSLPLACWRVALDGDWAYVSLQGSGFAAVDVSVPSNPVVVWTLDVTAPVGVSLAGEHAYVLNGSQLSSVHVASPAKPVVIGSMALPEAGPGVDVEGDIAIVTAGTSASVVDVSDPSSPQVLGSVETGVAWCADIVGDLAYLGRVSNLTVVDLSDPTSPAVVAVSPFIQGPIYELVVAGDDVFVQTPVSVGRVDVSDPTSPTVEALHYEAETGGSNLVVQDGYVYSARSFSNRAVNGLYVYEAETLSQVAFVPLEDVEYVTIVGDYLYCTSTDHAAVDIFTRNPTNPVLVASVALGTCGRGTVFGDIAVFGGSLVRVADVSDPLNPTTLYTAGGASTKIAWSGDHIVRNIVGETQVLRVLERRLDFPSHIAQSLVVTPGVLDPIDRVRLKSVGFTGGGPGHEPRIEVTGNGGASWLALPIDGNWRNFNPFGGTPPSRDIQWRATLDEYGYKQNPTLLDLELEFMYACPVRRLVDDNAAPGGDGRDFSTPMNDLQLALELVPHCTDYKEIWVREGTYKPAGPGGDKLASFVLPTDVKLYGGFPQGGWSSGSRDPNLTVLSGDLNGNDDPADDATLDDNSENVVRADSTDAGTILDGFTIRGGALGGERGAALRVFAGDVAVTDCRFIDNVSWDQGAVLTTDSSSVSFMGCEFADNRALYGSAAGVSVLNGSTASFDSCTFHDNRLTVYGGAAAAFVFNASASFEDCDFVDNFGGLNNPNWWGGAVVVGGNSSDPGSASFLRCDFSGNEGSVGGGLFAYGDVTLRDCRFLGNTALLGGAIGATVYVSNTVVQMDNCVFSGNLATDWGGAVIAENADLAVRGCTFVANGAGEKGGAIHFAGDGPLAIGNSILWGNTVATNPPVDETGQLFADDPSVVALNYSCVQDWSGFFGGTGNIGADPLLADPDGPDDVFGTGDDHPAPGEYSPAIDAGSNALVAVGVTADVTGEERFADDTCVDDTGEGTAPIVDMGAYEVQEGSCATPVTPGLGEASVAFRIGRLTPNPSPGRSTLGFSLPSAQEVNVTVFDARGRLVCRLASGPHKAGIYRVEWDGRDEAGSRAASGVYFVRLEAESGREVQRLVRVK